MRGRAAFLALTVLAGLSSAVKAEAFEPRVPDTFFGVSAPTLWSLTESNRDDERDDQLSAMKDAGLDWARVELGWPEIEPAAPTGGAHEYRWALSDRLVAAMASRGMELMALPMATPGWAASAAGGAAGCGRTAGVAQDRIGDYASFVAAIMARYGRGGSFWELQPDLPETPIARVEVWNEPNLTWFWCPAPDPELYGALLQQTADAIHGVDPDAQVILGGLAALRDEATFDGSLGISAGAFLERALAAEPGLADAIDAVGFHPYDLDPAIDLSMLAWLRRTMDAGGLGEAGIALTEFGWRAGAPGQLTEEARVRNYTELTGWLAQTDCGISAVAAHTWTTSELNTLNPEDWWGLVAPGTGLIHPAGIAYLEQVALFEGRGPAAPSSQTLSVCSSYQADIAAPDRPHTQRLPDSFFGATMVQLPNDLARLPTEYEAVSGAGIGQLRQRINWSHIEPVAPGAADYQQRSGWAWLDRIVLRMAVSGIGLTPSFGALPSWMPATGTEFDDGYAAFLQRFAGRFGEGGAFWHDNGMVNPALAVRRYEIWQHGNSNQGTSDGSASAAEYAATYESARAALRAVQPGAEAIASLTEYGVGGRADAFLRAMVAARPALRGGIDGVYVMAEASQTLVGLDALVRGVRQALDQTGNATTPIYLGFGAPTGGPGSVTEAARADLFSTLASHSARGDCGVEGIFAHAWTTPETNPDSVYHWFGIADPYDSALRASAEAYRDVAFAYRGLAGGADDVGTLQTCDALPPDRDGDGTFDYEDPEPLDPSVPEAPTEPPPAPSIEGGPSARTVLDTATFTLVAEGATGFECKLDQRDWERCNRTATYLSLAEGSHELRARALAWAVAGGA